MVGNVPFFKCLFMPFIGKASVKQSLEKCSEHTANFPTGLKFFWCMDTKLATRHTFIKKEPQKASKNISPYIFAVWAGVRKVASADIQVSIVHAQNSSRDSQATGSWNPREFRGKLPANYSPRAFVLFFCFAPCGFEYFSRKISTDRLF